MVRKREETERLIKKEIENKTAVLASSLLKRFRGHIERGQSEPYVVSDPNTPEGVIHLAVEQLRRDYPNLEVRHFREGLYDKVQFLP